MIAALIVAAGRGLRAQKHSAGPKQYVKIAGEVMLTRTLRTFLEHNHIDLVQVVIHPEDKDLYAEALPESRNKLALPIPGGATRQESTLAGLDALQTARPDVVLIHDAARPLVDPATISAVIAALDEADGAIAAQPVNDTLKRAHPSTNTICTTVARTDMWRAQTPQAFHFDKILRAHRNALETSATSFTDDASIAEAAGLKVRLVEGGLTNIKITTVEDFALAETYLRAPTLDIRVGQGYDVHKFEPGNHVWLCGVRIEHTQGLNGHSDADVAMHALTDAIYGALSDGDIGHHFPPSDERWRGAASDIFLRDAVERVINRGGYVMNADVTLVCETPKIGPHRDAMRAKLASIIKIDVSRIAVKATTSEGLGFTGRREGIAALATATIAIA